MQLYEISGFSYHTPLSGGEIAKLFRAGRLARDAKCKAVDALQWRTVDELFPLLKYDSAGEAAYTVDEKVNAAVTTRHVVVAVAATVVVAVTAFALFLLYQRSVAPAPPSQTARVIAPPLQTVPDVSSSPRIAAPNPGANLPHALPTISSTAPVMQVPRAQPFNPESDRRFAEEQRRREQEQRDQATIAERIREKNAREAAQKQLAAGTDTIIPLGEFHNVALGGSWVSVKIHDNDVTSFDAWVNGAFYDDVRKQKGISGTRTDETLIYSNGRASLYYVWEISGKLNHCHLRVRER